MTQLLRLYVLDFGLFEVQAGRTIGIPGYLLQTTGGQNILVDTGFPAKYAADAHAAGLEDNLNSFGRLLDFTQRQLPTAQLALLGLTLADIDLLILSHGDIDHVGALAEFSERRIVVGAAERAMPRPRYFDHQPLEWPQADYQLIKRDTVLMPGLEVLLTPGHSPGHLSLLLELPQTGQVLLTCDAISRPAELSDGLLEGETLIQAQRLMGIAEAQGAMVIYGHDPQQWGELKKAPEFYS